MNHPLPAEAVVFLREPQHAVIGWIGNDGRPLTVATWYDWDDGQILLNMDARRKRLPSLSVGAAASLTVLDAHNWYRHLSLYGSIVRVTNDPDRTDIDRLSQRYAGTPYHDRTRPRVSAWMTIEAWHGWIEGKPWPKT